MMYPWQQSQWSHIKALITGKRLPHAMLLLGNAGLGKADFASALANAVLCQQPGAEQQACGQCKSCQLLKAETHPDLRHLRPAAPATSKSANPVLSIRIDDIRELCNQLNQTSQYGAYRVSIIEQADYLTTSAANSLLKTLEEPGDNVLILLTTARPHRLPATIRSRCQTLRFIPPETSQSLEWLQQNAESQSSASQNDSRRLQQALKQAHGSPLAALDALQEIEHQALLSAAMTAKVSGKNSLEYPVKLAKFAKVKNLEGMLSWASDLSRLLACGPDIDLINEHQRTQLQALSSRVSEQRLFRFYDQLNFNLKHGSIALNEQLLWENLLLSWDNL